MSKQAMFLYMGIYGSTDDAEADYESVRVLHHEGAIGAYDVAIITKDATGDVKVHKHEKPTQRGAWLGLVAGGIIGVIFPATLVATTIWAGSGAAFGGIVGHLSRGLSRSDLKDVGEELDSGDVALILVAKDKVDAKLDRILAKADKRTEKILEIDEKALQAKIDRAFDGE